MTGPDGSKAHAAIANNAFSASFRYPDDFQGDSNTDDGTYDYEWYVTGGPRYFGTPTGRVATGSFNLGGQEESGNGSD